MAHARYNPFFLGKKTAVGTSLSGRLVRSKSKKRRLSGAALLAWRKKHVKGRRRVKSLLGGTKKSRRLNPWFLGKKTAVGSKITGRVVKSKHKGKRLSKAALLSWRKTHVKGRRRVSSLLKGSKKSRRLNPTHGNKGLSARIALLERKIAAITKAHKKMIKSLSAKMSHRRLNSGY